jgi:hypothetical protein
MSPDCSTRPTPCPVRALVPVTHWSRLRIVLNEEPHLLSGGEILYSVRKLDMRLVSLANRTVALQVAWLSLDRNEVGAKLEAHFVFAGLGMEPLRLERDLCAWRTVGADKAVAMAGNATLRADGSPIVRCESCGSAA